MITSCLFHGKLLKDEQHLRSKQMLDEAALFASLSLSHETIMDFAFGFECILGKQYTKIGIKFFISYVLICKII